MSNHYEEYQKHADECVEMSRKALTSERRASWLRLAAEWLRMLPGEQGQTPEQSFRMSLEANGTGQEDSTASH